MNHSLLPRQKKQLFYFHAKLNSGANEMSRKFVDFKIEVNLKKNYLSGVFLMKIFDETIFGSKTNAPF